MTIKKSEIYSALWESCDELRGSMDPSQYKDYILTLLFVKYVTDRYKGDKFAEIVVPEGKTLGEGGSFDDMVAIKNDKNIGEKMDIIISKLAEANGLKGVIDVAQFNDEEKIGKGKEMVDKLTNLVGIFQDERLNFQKNRAGGDDILGDAYEYLMRNFATDSGKSKGQFYTPAEVSRIMAKVIGINNASQANQTLYDMACGSGSLLIRAADESPVDVTIYGQEKDGATAGLAKMNLVLHNKATGSIHKNNTLADPFYKYNDRDGKEVANRLRQFDFCVANPPFSLKAWGQGLDPEHDEYGRFSEFGVPPEKNGDYAWLLHMIASMKSRTGKGAIILPHGVLFRGNAEAIIRKNLIVKGYIKGIIGLPTNLFYGTGIPACIIVLDKENAETRKGIFMINASKGFMKDGNKNRLRECDIHKIVTVFNNQLGLPKYSRMVTITEIIEDNDFDLNISRYIDNSEPEDIQNIEAHLLGGIPKEDIDELNVYWSVFPNMREKLYSNYGREGFLKLLVPKDEVRRIIFEDDEFAAYSNKVNEAFNKWKDPVSHVLNGLNQMVNPKNVINFLGEKLLEIFKPLELMEEYDTYQHLLTYWQDIMYDDVYAICYDGWDAAKGITVEMTKPKSGNPKEKGWEGSIIPKKLIINEYFADEQNAINKLLTERDEIVVMQDEMKEEYGGEEGPLSEILEDGKIKAKDLKARIKELIKTEVFEDEIEIYRQYEKLMEDETTYNKSIKTSEESLDKVVRSKYSELSEAELKKLVIQRKWYFDIFDGIYAIYSGISNQLANRIIELAKRYEFTLSECQSEAEEYEMKVKSHLERMGYIW